MTVANLLDLDLPALTATCERLGEKPAPAERAAGDGWLRLGSKPSTSITVDGNPIDTGAVGVNLAKDAGKLTAYANDLKDLAGLRHSSIRFR